MFNFQDETFFFWFCWYWWNFRPSLFTLSFLYVFLCFILCMCVLCCMTVVDRGLNMWLIINVFCFSTNPNVLHEVTFGTHMEYPDGSLPSKFNINITNVLHEVTFGTHMEYPDGSVPSQFNINITKVLMYYMKWSLEHTWSTHQYISIVVYKKILDQIEFVNQTNLKWLQYS